MSIRIPPTIAPDVADVLRQLSTEIATVTGTQNIDLSKRRIMNAGNAVGEQDYITRTDLRQAIAGVTSGPAPTPPKPSASITFGTHSARTALAPAQAKTVFYFETDREALYAVQLLPGPPTWALICAAMTGSLAGRPGDLGSSEEGFVFYAQDQGTVYYWSGAIWHLETGNIVDTFTNRPAGGGSNIAGGVRFTASDRGYQEWEYDLANTRWQFAGGGQSTRGVIGSITGSLTAQDSGYLYFATDYDRLYRWTGSAWEDAPGQPTRGAIAFFDSALAPSTGWQLCDGSSVSRSTSTGGTTTYVVPNLTTASRFLRSVSGTTGGTGGSATTHTHQVDPPNTTTNGPSSINNEQSGAGQSSADTAHTHDVNIPAFASAGPSGTGGDDALPPYYNARPYVRL